MLVCSPVTVYQVDRYIQLCYLYHLPLNGANDYGLPIVQRRLPLISNIGKLRCYALWRASFPENLFGRGIPSTFVLVSLSRCSMLFASLIRQIFGRDQFSVASDSHLLALTRERRRDFCSAFGVVE